ncbi:hypothetical protein [Jejuia spongiicola]|uniref:Uncharacterized protein n=1 Tax=Jejuia spongiicola TaxID=2942207 RepID=A0ABT0Q999_9FLAO|nr:MULTISPECIES: hypothetical protein [Flavobacteriaceae]MCL6293525.1 hypothetical protein [Jejuia spongiicola]PIA78908.1 hypothetical protein BFR04_05140 [Gaetbulibacter sp. 4G1]
MKKKLEAELISIAHRILKLKGKEDVIKLHAESAELYEKLSVLKFAHENFEDDIPSIGNDSSFFDMLDTAFNNKVSDNIEVEDKVYINLDDVEEDEITEPLMETIKDMVAQMPQETLQVDSVFEEAIPKQKQRKNDLESITSGFEDMPVFEPVSKSQNGNEKKTLNDKLKKGELNIGLNDKIAFIKHLFNGKSEDYDRVVSQLNTSMSFSDAKRFIEDIVKPDYNDWADKEEFEERFIQIIESKFL